MAHPSTQNFLEVDQIKEGVVILRNKGLRGILMVPSLNFALKSEAEQNATIYQFQGFLNSLDFFCQIVVQSRRLNITGYLDKLKELETKQTNELMRIQTNEYRLFVQQLVESGSILTKSFFVIVPYSVSEDSGDITVKKGLFSSVKIPVINDETFARARTQLWHRMEFVAMGLKRCGLQAVPLTTPEVVELYWGLHHPKEAEVGYYPEFPMDTVI
ncbi:MAG: hypothetical protein V1905_01725 [bacterium]